MRCRGSVGCDFVKKRKTRRIFTAGFGKERSGGVRPDSLLPRAFLVAIRLQALSALVLVHLQTTFLFQIAHGELIYGRGNVRLARRSVKPNLLRRHAHAPA
jgi:hypothetical protein